MAWTAAEILDAIEEWIAEHGEPPTVLDWQPSLARFHGERAKAERFEREGCWPTASVVARAFGRWNNALQQVGAPHTHQGVWRRGARHRAVGGQPTGPWTREQVIEAMQDEAARLGRWPMWSEWEAEDPEGRRPTAATVQLLFGKWSTAVRLAGGQPLVAGEMRITRERREMIRELVRRPGITLRDIAEEVGATPDVVTRHLRRMREQGEELPVPKRWFRWTPETIVAALRDDAAHRGRWPTCTEWQQRGDGPGLSTIRRHFGSWTKAIRAAGGDPVGSGNRPEPERETQ